MFVQKSWLLFGMVYSALLFHDAQASSKPHNTIQVRKRTYSEPPKPSFAPALVNSNQPSAEHTPAQGNSGSASPQASKRFGSVNIKMRTDNDQKYAANRAKLFSSSRTASQAAANPQEAPPQPAPEPPAQPAMQPIAAFAVAVYASTVHDAPTVREDHPSPALNAQGVWAGTQPSPLHTEASFLDLQEPQPTHIPVTSRRCCRCPIACAIL